MKAVLTPVDGVSKLLWCLPNGDMIEVPQEIQNKAKAANNGTMFMDRRTKSFKIIQKWAESVDIAQTYVL